MKRIFVSIILVIGLWCFQDHVDAQDSIIGKKDADFVFSLTRPEWNKSSKRFFAPGWIIRSVEHESSGQVIGFDPSTGMGLSVQSLYANDHDSPLSVIVGNYFPVGILPPMTDEMKREMETAVQKDLEPSYSIRLIYSLIGDKEAQALGLKTRIEVIELILTKKQ